jgi:hypothetical protein
VSILTREPKPIVMGSPKSDERGTEIVLVFTYHTPGTFLKDEVEPAFGKCQVTATLEATTYWTIGEHAFPLSTPEICRHPLAMLKTRRFKSQKRTIKLDPWKRADKPDGDSIFGNPGTGRTSPTAFVLQHGGVQTV